jgi:hypothetical protein
MSGIGKDAAAAAAAAGRGLRRLLQRLLGPDRGCRAIPPTGDAQRVSNAQSCNEGQDRPAGQPNQNVQQHIGHLNCPDNRQPSQDLESPSGVPQLLHPAPKRASQSRPGRSGAPMSSNATRTHGKVRSHQTLPAMSTIFPFDSVSKRCASSWARNRHSKRAVEGR